jgi:alpha-tubulin suppressor-like RCC1 family protein
VTMMLLRSKKKWSVVALSGLVVAGVVVVACSDDNVRVGFTNDQQPDSQANLPPVGDSDAGNVVGDAAVDPDARGAFNPNDEAVVCNTLPCAVEIASGDHHFCARLNDGTVRCWGDNEHGQLGSTNPVDAGSDAGVNQRPRAVSGLNGVVVTQISAAASVACARVDDGGVRCWGDNRHAELGLSAKDPVVDDLPHPNARPVALSGGSAVRVDVGHGSVCATLTSGKVACWGKDDQTQLARTGGSTGTDPLNPVRVPGLAEVDAVTTGLVSVQSASFTLLGLSTAGEAWSWGALAGVEGVVSGRVSSVSPDRTPRRLLIPGKITSLSVSASVEVEPDDGHGPGPGPGIPGPTEPPPPPRAHACAIANGEVYCWGRSYAGALCTGLPDKEQEPAHAPILAQTWPQQLSASDEITCARMTDGSVYCCGSDVAGRLGKGTTTKGSFEAFFAKARGFTGNAVKVAASKASVCALTKEGAVQCWGSNQKGELARVPDEDAHPTAVPIAF